MTSRPETAGSPSNGIGYRIYRRNYHDSRAGAAAVPGRSKPETVVQREGGADLDDVHRDRDVGVLERLSDPTIETARAFERILTPHANDDGRRIVNTDQQNGLRDSEPRW